MKSGEYQRMSIATTMEKLDYPPLVDDNAMPFDDVRKRAKKQEKNE
jgi:hypothetical protein